MHPRTRSLLRTIEHPLVRLAAAALLQAAADHLARTRTTTSSPPPCSGACGTGT